MTMRTRKLHVPLEFLDPSCLFYCLRESLFLLDTTERPFLVMPKHRKEKKERKEKKKREKSGKSGRREVKFIEVWFQHQRV